MPFEFARGLWTNYGHRIGVLGFLVWSAGLVGGGAGENVVRKRRIASTVPQPDLADFKFQFGAQISRVGARENRMSKDAAPGSTFCSPSVSEKKSITSSRAVRGAPSRTASAASPRAKCRAHVRLTMLPGSTSPENLIGSFSPDSCRADRVLVTAGMGHNQL